MGSIPVDTADFAPATISPGARSPPSASTATRTVIAGALLRSLDPERLDVAAPVRLAVRAYAMRELRLPAGRADLDARDGDPMLRAALVAPRPGCFPLWDGHERPRSIPARSTASGCERSLKHP
jgi:hypothetical protein